ncbi:hypothetical protein [Bacillus infantis]|uniref:hypothetical protein n=1 Tax=Bacillus infantis TaxID=324767 RepID=UPI003CFAF234
MISASQNFINTMKFGNYSIHIKIELYDHNYNYIKEISQQVDSDLGSLTINNDSPIRRSFTIDLDNSLGEFIFGEENLIWINKRLKLFLGLSNWKNEIEYIPMGVFVLSEPSDSHTLDGKSATITAVDKAYFMTDKRGKFVNEQIIETGTKITDAIRIIASHVGETLFNFDNVTDTVPYELTYGGEDNRWDALEELATLAKCTISYDVYGYLRLKKIDLNAFENEPVTWEYKYGDPTERFYAGNVRKFNESNLANHIRVLGGSSDTAEVIYDLKVDENDPAYGNLWKGNPYSIQQIGLVSYFHNGNSPDSLITTASEAKWRAKFELMNRLGFAEEVELSIAANFLHDVDDVIYLEDHENGITGHKYLIQQINLPLSPSIMTMNLIRYRKLLDNWDFI